jgi:hypothetical protein
VLKGGGELTQGECPTYRFRLTFRAGWLTPDSLVGLCLTRGADQACP